MKKVSPSPAGEGDLVGFLPDDFIDYEALPDGDTVDLYAAWYDPVVYGVTYHANRPQSDSYTVEDAQFSDDGGNTLTIQGLDGEDESMQNPGKTFVSWNTAPDGSGETVETDKGSTLAQLGLGTRAQYLQDLEKLAALDIEETPIHYTESEDASKLATQAEGQGSSATADEFEAELEDKYTVHLYAQWSNEPTKAEANTEVKKAASTTQSSQSKAPTTGDAMTFATVAIVVIALIATAVLLASFSRRRQ